MDIVEVIKGHIERGEPPYKAGKKLVLEMCDKLGIKTIDQFYDMLYDALRKGCDWNFWQHLQGRCLDSVGDHIAYGKDEIGEALGKDPKDLTCEDICYTCGSCAHINKIDLSIFKHLSEMMDDRGLKLDEPKQ